MDSPQNRTTRKLLVLASKCQNLTKTYRVFDLIGACRQPSTVRTIGHEILDNSLSKPKQF